MKSIRAHTIVNLNNELYLKRWKNVSFLSFLFLWQTISSFYKSYSIIISPLFFNDILFNEFRSLCLPFDKENSGVYSIHEFVNKSIKKLMTVITPRLYFQSLTNQETKAIQKTPNAKLICKSIIMRWLSLSTTSSLIKE